MNRPRVSLLGLMGVVALVAVGIAALRIPWPTLRTSALFTLVVFILLTATLGALLRRGAPWVGFALFGWAWLVISFASLEIMPLHSTADRIPVPMPIASMWLVEWHQALLRSDEEGNPVAMIPNGKGGFSLVPHALVQACHLGSSLLAGGVGALLARGLAGRGEPSTRE